MNSDLSKQQLAGRQFTSLFRERTALMFVSAITFGMFLGWLGQEGYRGLPPDMFQVMKTDWKARADMVLAGDSRIRTAVSPTEMQKVLPEHKILNYAFGHAGFGGEYLAAIAGVLDPASSRKTIVLGVTPLSLTTGSVRDNVFLEFMNKSANEKRMIRYCGRLLHFFQPRSPRELLTHLNRRPRRDDGFMEYADDGWLGFHAKAQEVFAPGPYADIFGTQKNGPVHADIVDGLIRATKEWGRKGIVVYGFRPPTPPEMTELENQWAQFDEGAFVFRFEEAGGRWLKLDFSEYTTVDGSHLTAESAVLFSRILANAVRDSSVERSAKQ